MKPISKALFLSAATYLATQPTCLENTDYNKNPDIKGAGIVNKEENPNSGTEITNQLSSLKRRISNVLKPKKNPQISGLSSLSNSSADNNEAPTDNEQTPNGTSVEDPRSAIFRRKKTSRSPEDSTDISG